MKKLGIIAAMALLLTACAAQAEPEPTPTETPDVNATACEAFAEATLTVGEAVTESRGLEIDIPAEFDAVALQADGDVKTRILDLIDRLPDPPHMIVWMDNRDAYSADIENVVRACTAAGHDIEVVVLTGGS